jgi:hypothetical protein
MHDTQSANERDAERKGAAVTACMRCGQRIPPRLP